MLDVHARSTRAIFSVTLVLAVHSSTARVVEQLLDAHKMADQAIVISKKKLFMILAIFTFPFYLKILYYLLGMLN